MEARLAKSFFNLPRDTRERLQETIPLKILKRLKNAYDGNHKGPLTLPKVIQVIPEWWNKLIVLFILYDCPCEYKNIENQIHLFILNISNLQWSGDSSPASTCSVLLPLLEWGGSPRPSTYVQGHFLYWFYWSLSMSSLIRHIRSAPSKKFRPEQQLP